MCQKYYDSEESKVSRLVSLDFYWKPSLDLFQNVHLPIFSSVFFLSFCSLCYEVLLLLTDI